MFFSNKNLVAIDLGTSNIKLAEIDHSRRGPILRKFGVFPIHPGMIANGEILEIGSVTQAISDLVTMSKTKRTFAITGMWGNAVIVKKITMPKMEANLVAEQLKWEAEQYIPFDINEISLEHHILSPKANSETMDVLLVAAKQEFLFRFIECIESAKLKCAVIDLVGFALANCFEANYGTTDRPVALINIGGGVTNFVVVERGEVIFCRDIPVGGSTYTSEINKGMNVSFQEAEALKISASLGQEVPDEVNSIIRSTNDQLVEEIKNSFEFYAATAGGTQISRYFASGGSVYVPGLVEQITKISGVPYEVFDPFLRIQYDPKVFSADYINQIKSISPVALGLALRKLEGK